MLSAISRSRPNCHHLLEDRMKWALNPDDEEIFSILIKFIDNSNNFEDEKFYRFIISEKLKYEYSKLNCLR